MKNITDIVLKVEIDFDQCAHTYGEAPCTASLGTTGNAKCFNSRATCQDVGNYSATTRTLTLVPNQAGVGANEVPVIEQVNISPPKLGGGVGTDKPLGERGSLTITAIDIPWDDVILDKYYLQRSSGEAGVPAYDPIAKGTLWTKFRARYPYYLGRKVRVITGDSGGLRTRHYLQEEWSGFGSGRVTIKCKDPLRMLDDKRAQCPAPSRGVLWQYVPDPGRDTPIEEDDDPPFNILIAPKSAITDYMDTDLIVIGEELFRFEVDSEEDAELTITERALNRVRTSHDLEDKVQAVHKITSPSETSLTADVILEDLLRNFTDIPSDIVDRSAPQWEAERKSHIPWGYQALIAKPTPVKDLIESLALEAGFGVSFDDIRNRIEIRAIREPNSGTLEITDDIIVAGSISITDRPDKRLSQVWTNFGILDPVSKLDEASNYRQTLVGQLPVKESSDEWGQPAIKNVFSRFIPRLGWGAAQDINQRILSRYGDIPRDISFSLPIELADEIEEGETYVFKSRRLSDTFGNADTIPIRIMSVKEDQNIIRVTAEEQRYSAVNVPGEPDRDFRIIFATNQNNVNLRAAFEDVTGRDPDPNESVPVVIQPGVVIGSSSTSAPAFDVGQWPSGVTINIIIHPGATILGAGGAGGKGGDFTVNTPPEPGAAGGTAIYTRYPIIVDNQGAIASGGGGGGGGGRGMRAVEPNIFEANGGSGGGGAGQFPGQGGVGTGAIGFTPPTSPGSPGTISSGGSGSVGQQGDATGGTGGAGGNPGQDGQPGTIGTGNEFSEPGAPGGSAGAAVDGDSHVTFSHEGTILGSRIN